MRNWFSLLFFGLALVVGCGKNEEATKPTNPAPLPKVGPTDVKVTGGAGGVKPLPPPPAPEPP